jgi:hypothetical protein
MHNLLRAAAKALANLAEKTHQCSDSVDRLALQQAIAIDPEQFAQRGGVTAVGLAFLAFVRLDQNRFATPVIVQHANQPVVEATDLEYGDECFVRGQPLAGEPLEESVDLLGLRRYLASLKDVAVLVAEGDRDLPCMLIDAKVKHRLVLLSSCWVKGQLSSP